MSIDDPELSSGEPRRRERLVEEERAVRPALPGEPLEAAPAGIDGAPRQVTERERVDVHPDGSVERRLDRTEDGPIVARRRPMDPVLPAMLLILVAAIGAGVAWWLLSRDDTATVPGVTGLQVDAAVARLQDEGFDSTIRRGDNPAPVDEVYAQEPSPGTELATDGTVSISVSAGPAAVSVPNTVGLSEGVARDRLAEVGLDVEVERRYSDQPVGIVTAQQPAAGQEASPSSTATLVVSQGRATATVPNVVGENVNEAQRAVAEAGFEVNVVQVPSPALEGTVVAQNPVGGSAEKGSAVRLNVAAGP